MHIRREVTGITVDPETFDVIVPMPDGGELVLDRDDLRAIVDIYHSYHESIDMMDLDDGEEGDPLTLSEINEGLKKIIRRLEN